MLSLCISDVEALLSFRQKKGGKETNERGSVAVVQDTEWKGLISLISFVNFKE